MVRHGKVFNDNYYTRWIQPYSGLLTEKIKFNVQCYLYKISHWKRHMIVRIKAYYFWNLKCIKKLH